MSSSVDQNTVNVSQLASNNNDSLAADCATISEEIGQGDTVNCAKSTANNPDREESGVTDCGDSILASDKDSQIGNKTEARKGKVFDSKHYVEAPVPTTNPWTKSQKQNSTQSNENKKGICLYGSILY